MENNLQPQSDFSGIGKRLKAFRNKKGFTQERIASEIGVSVKYWSDIERGQQGPSRDFLLRLIEHFDISIDYLLTGAVSKESDNPLVAEYMKCPEIFREDFVTIIGSIRKMLENLEHDASH